MRDIKIGPFHTGTSAYMLFVALIVLPIMAPAVLVGKAIRKFSGKGS